MSIPVLTSAHPVTIPSKVYDKVWIEEVVISAPDPNADALARVRYRRFAVVDGVAELEPAPSQWLEVQDVLATATSDPDLDAVVSRLMTYIERIGREQGVVAPDSDPVDEDV